MGIATEETGRPGWTRTNDPQLRRLMLYPPELRAHILSLAWQTGPAVQYIET